MSKQSINDDAFLKSQGIEVERSDFLKKVLDKKQKGIKQQYNLLDIHGRRLSRYWEPGDTFATVVVKRMKENVYTFFNPDTYTPQTFKEVKQFLIRQKLKFLGIAITLIAPWTLYKYAFLPRLKRVKRLYLMQFYNKMGFFSKQFGIKTKPVSQKDLQNSL